MTDEYKVIYAPAALDDLRTIYSYIAYELMAEKAAENQTNRIRDRIRKLEYYPEKHKQVDWEPWASMHMRFMPVDRYVVYYSVNKTEMTVTVARIFHAGRDVERILREETE